jgi:hypothetical protein
MRSGEPIGAGRYCPYTGEETLRKTSWRSTYAHNDPAGAYPHNAFFAHLVPFLVNIGVHK